MRFPVRRPSMPKLPSLPSIPNLPSLSSLPHLSEFPRVEAMAAELQAQMQRLRTTAGALAPSELDVLEETLRAEGVLLDNYRPSQAFAPRRVLQNGTVQTLLARRRPLDSVALRLEVPMMIDAGYDFTGVDPDRPVRLLGYYNPAISPMANRGLVLLIHGWEGNSHSSDLIFMADALLRAGFATFRLNLRDHGPNLHADRLALNRGLFLGTLIEEVHRATEQIAALASGGPVYLAGGSMGGNFVLRMAVRHNEFPIPGLAKVVAICPAINPSSAIDAIDQQTAYRTFFRARWLMSLKAKQRRFPELYDFADIEHVRRLREMTARVTPRYSPWATEEEYFAHYAIGNEALTDLRVATTVIAAADDRVIPVRDIYRLEPHDHLKVQIHRTGGHMGFVDIFPYRRWLPQAVLAELRDL
ncbi:MAG: YheT family hydrolase [Caldilineaceae bacterium]